MMEERRAHDLEDADALDDIVSGLQFELKRGEEILLLFAELHHRLKQRVHVSMDAGSPVMRHLVNMEHERRRVKDILAEAGKATTTLQHSVNALLYETQAQFGPLKSSDREHPAAASLRQLLAGEPPARNRAGTPAPTSAHGAEIAGGEIHPPGSEYMSSGYRGGPSGP
jgi:hypothetical protein